MAKQASDSEREIQSVRRALDILDCFDSRNEELALNEIGEMLGLNKSTIYGILHTLYRHGYISKNENNGKYRLGGAFANRSSLVTDSFDNSLYNTAIKYLKRTTSQYSIVSYLFSYRNGMLSCLEMIIPHNSFGAVSSILGKRMAYHAAASGKVVLAHLTGQELEIHFAKHPLISFTEFTITDRQKLLLDIQRTRASGYTLERDEIDIGLSAIAVPIYDENGSLIGTISGSGTSERLNSIEKEVVEDFKNYSRAISAQLLIK